MNPLTRLFACAMILFGTAAVAFAVNTAELVPKALEQADENRVEIQKALDEVPPDQREGLRFLIAHMAERDLSVQYHARKRPKPDQTPFESIEASYASCTGLSILLIDACRAVAVPARFAGTYHWTTKVATTAGWRSGTTAGTLPVPANTIRMA